jgi:hypothetical protein
MLERTFSTSTSWLCPETATWTLPIRNLGIPTQRNLVVPGTGFRRFLIFTLLSHHHGEVKLRLHSGTFQVSHLYVSKLGKIKMIRHYFLYSPPDTIKLLTLTQERKRK